MSASFLSQTRPWLCAWEWSSTAVNGWVSQNSFNLFVIFTSCGHFIFCFYSLWKMLFSVHTIYLYGQKTVGSSMSLTLTLVTGNPSKTWRRGLLSPSAWWLGLYPCGTIRLNPDNLYSMCFPSCGPTTSRSGLKGQVHSAMSGSQRFTLNVVYWSWLLGGGMLPLWWGRSFSLCVRLSQTN